MRLVLACLSLIALFAWGSSWNRAPHQAAAPEPEYPRVDSLRCVTFEALMALPEATRRTADIALIDLLCAQTLPGTEDAILEGCLTTLDDWARRVRSETERHLYRFRARPDEYENSESYFRMLMMTVVLAEDFRVHYNPERIAGPAQTTGRDGFFADSRDVFLHGLLDPRRAGTCSSMPVLLVALGRRLGYPLKLVTTKGHLFARWENGSERFNIEATGKGLFCAEDSYYKTWPFKVTEKQIEEQGYLESLAPEEELAVFLSIRGHCLKEAGRADEAATCYSHAARLAPHVSGYRFLLADAQAQATSRQNRRSPDPELANVAKTSTKQE